MKQWHFLLASVLLSVCLLFALFTISSYASNTLKFEFDGNDVYTYYYTDALPGRSIFTGAIEMDSTIDSFYIESEIHLAEPIPVNKVFNVELGINMNAGTFTDVSCKLLKADKSSASSNSYAPSFYGGSNGGFELKNAQADLAAVEIILFKVKVSYPSWTVINLPSFTIDGNTYYFESGMTWVDWVASDYNFDGFYFEDDSNSLFYTDGTDKYYVEDANKNSSPFDGLMSSLILIEPEEPEAFYCNYGGYYFVDSTAFKQLGIALIENGHTDSNKFLFEFYYSGFGKKCSSISALQGGTKYTVRYWTSTGSMINATSWDSIQSNDYKYIYPTSKQVIPEWFSNWLNTYCTWQVTQTYPTAASGFDNGLVNLSATSYVTYNYLFTPMSLSITEATAEDVSGGIFGFVKKIWQGITNLPQNIASSISGFFTELGNKIVALGQTILDGIKNLFVPTSDDITAVKGKFETLLSERFGAVYDSSEIIDDFASVFTTNGVSATSENTISFPSVTVNLAGSDFTFGGWDVDIIPDGFEVIVTTLKLITSVVCTFLFVNGLRKRLDAILK